MRFASPPLLIRKYYSSLTWRIPVDDKKIFLTFDDGPIPEVTPFVLQQLKNFNCKATFFCIGNNVKNNPSLYKQIIDEGHAVGNHTFNHVNGWKTKTQNYLDEISQCAQLVKSNLFRPPYGKITKSQIKQLTNPNSSIHLPTFIIMWDVLSYDFDKNVSENKCFENVISNLRPGSIVVFHDSIKAEKNLRYALPRVLEWILEKAYTTEIIQ
jgi:peptidoglycan/xylan/chitin deacetylase (PgdA/CDA1 family)